MRRLLLLALFLWAIIAMVYAACAYASPVAPETVAACEPVGRRFYPGFSAYVDAASVLHSWGDARSRFAFERCLAERGVVLGPSRP